MLFNSYPFLFLFAPIAIAIFGLFSQEKNKKIWLLLCSVAFYGIWSLPFLAVLTASMVVNYAFSRAISRMSEQGKNTLFILSSAIILNCFVLVYYKFLISWPLEWHGHQLNFLFKSTSTGIPLGISFYTFTQTAFLIDCNSGHTRAKSFLEYALFVTFFPHLIAGPILHHSEVIPQFSQNNNFRLSAKNLSIGLSLFLFGLSKKTIIADTLAQVANRGFQHVGAINTTEAWAATFFYAFQLYFDFSGYSDMANGLAKCFGIDFPLNFNSPFKSRSVIEFWQRWHMTLTRYLTTLIFNPLSSQIRRHELKHKRSILLNSKKDFKNIISFLKLVGLPVIFTMCLAGIWHGIGLTFLAFGLLHGISLSLNHGWRSFVVNRHRLQFFSTKLYRILCQIFTFFFVVSTFVIFRAQTFAEASSFMRLMRSPKAFINNLRFEFDPFLNITFVEYTYLAIGILIIFLAPNVYQMTRPYYQVLGHESLASESWIKWRPNFLWAFVSALLLCVSLVMISAQGAKEFLYFQF